MISTILAAMANNFAILFPSYFAQYGFTGTAPIVSWFYGPKYLTQQSAPNQVVAVLGGEPFVGAEIHSTQPSAAPRELSRMWTRITFYCWGQPSQISAWTEATVTALLDDTLPTPANQNGNWFQCSTAGTTGSTEPTWPTTFGATVTDGDVVWTCMGTVDGFRIYDTDMTDLIRIAVAGAAHYTAVGSYKPVTGSWYDRTDQFVMSGFTNKVSFDFLVPVPDVVPTVAQINSATLTGIVTTP
jgi:hypothetical protein